jgi:hypothetical protein
VLTTACTRLGCLARFQRFHAHCGQLCSAGSHAATAQRVKPTVSAPRANADATVPYSFALWFAGFARQGPGCGRASRLRRHVIETATGARDGLQLRGAAAVGPGAQGGLAGGGGRR